MTDYTSLLGKSDQSWKQIATALLSEQQSKNKKAKRKQRRALVGALALSAWDNSKLNNVIRNLEDAKTDNQYQIADATVKWENYNKFITDDKGFIAAGGEPEKAEEINEYFKTVAAVNFNSANPNFEELYKNRANRHAEREEGINKIAKVLQADHLKKRNELKNTQAITGKSSPIYLTKEEFLKPYEDHYRAKQRRATDPSELGAVHQLFGLVGPGRKRRKALDAKIAGYEKIIKGYSIYDTLLDLPINSAPKAYYNPNDIGYTEADIVRLVETTVENDSLQRLLVTKARKMIVTNGIVDNANTALNEDTISDTQLQALLINTTVDFEKATIQAKQYKEEFADIWLVRRKETDLPFTTTEIDEGDGTIRIERKAINKDKFDLYEDEEDIYVAQKLGLYDENTVALQNALLGKHYETNLNINPETKNPRNPELILMYDKIISGSTTTDMAMSAARNWINLQLQGSARINEWRNVLEENYKVPNAKDMTIEELGVWYTAIFMDHVVGNQKSIEELTENQE